MVGINDIYSNIKKIFNLNRCEQYARDQRKKIYTALLTNYNLESETIMRLMRSNEFYSCFIELCNFYNDHYKINEKNNELIS